MKDTAEMVINDGIEDSKEISFPRPRHGFNGKQKIIIKVSMNSQKSVTTALKVAASFSGVEYVSTKGHDLNQMEFIGDAVDAAELASLLRKKLEDAELISVNPVGEPYHNYQVSESLADTIVKKLDGATEATTCINIGPDKEESPPTKEAESSFRSETTEWTLLITSLVLEGMSAVFDQLSYALTGMVLAFVGLLLSAFEFIDKARRERIALDRRSQLPSFHRHSTLNVPNDKLFFTISQYFGLACALWQCFYSTMEYQYARQNKDNPIKMCLLPFIFILCVVISKLIRSEPVECLAEPLREGEYLKMQSPDAVVDAVPRFFGEVTNEQAVGLGEKEKEEMVEQKQSTKTVG